MMLKKVALIKLIFLAKWVLEKIRALALDLAVYTPTLLEAMDTTVDALQEILGKIDPDDRWEWDDSLLEALNEFEEKYLDPTD